MDNKLIDLIKLAIGERSLTSFAKICGVSAGSLSRILKTEKPQMPTPKTLKKIANYADNGVTFEDLMAAAGYIYGNVAEVDSPTPDDVFDKEEFIKNMEVPIAKEIFIDQRIDKLKKDLLKHHEKVKFKDGTKVSKETLESFFENVEVALAYAKVRNEKNS